MCLVLSVLHHGNDTEQNNNHHHKKSPGAGVMTDLSIPYRHVRRKSLRANNLQEQLTALVRF